VLLLVSTSATERGDDGIRGEGGEEVGAADQGRVEPINVWVVMKPVSDIDGWYLD
jgi:hypothetical protein